MIALGGALAGLNPARSPLQPDADATSWQAFATYLSVANPSVYNCGFEAVANACPEVASDSVLQLS